MTMSMYKRRGARNLVAAILALGFMQAPVAFAATQGELGHTSKGSVQVNLKTDYLLKISGLEDINLPWDANKIVDGAMNEKTLTGKIEFCVFTNKPEGDQFVYNMTVISDNAGAGHAFKLEGSQGNDDTVGYDVFIDANTVSDYNSARGKWGVNHSPSESPVNDLVGGNTKDLLQCASGQNTSMWVVADLDNAIAAKPDSYRDTLTLQVSAE